MAEIYSLTRAEIEAITEEAARKAVAKVSRPTPPKAELTLSEAMELANCKSPSSFYRWSKRARVRSINNGRYRRSAILRGLGDAA